MTELTVVLPVYRNAETLAELIGRIHRVLDGNGTEHRILAVDDASPDASWKVLTVLGRNDPRLAAVRLCSNGGQHRALFLGLSLADSRKTAVMDADLQDPPELLPALLEKSNEEGTVVFAKRYGRYESSLRLAASAVHKSFLSLLTGVPRRCGTFFVISDSVRERMIAGASEKPQVVVLAGLSSSKIETVPFVRPSGRGTSSYGIRTLFAAAWLAYRNVLLFRTDRDGGVPPPVTENIDGAFGWVGNRIIFSGDISERHTTAAQLL